MLKLEESSLENADEWMDIANDALYTCIDFLSQLVLVSVLNTHLFSWLNFLFYPFLNEALPLLDLVAQTIGYGHPMPFITCVFRY